MLYLVGGAARSGKSLLAKRFCEELKIPYFSIDYLITVFDKSMPEVNISHEQATLERAQNLWPKLKPMLVNISEAEPNYFIDGEALLPKYVSEFQRNTPNTKACFLGYKDIDAKEKLKAIKEYTGPNNWTADLPDKEILKLIEEMVHFSKYLEKESTRYGFSYIDTSSDFTGSLNEAFDYLLG